MTNASIQQNLQHIRENIAEIASKAGRLPEEVKLIAVSKTHSADKVDLAVTAGQCHFGENRIQEALGKIEKLSDHSSIEWHLIGHLQKNKVRFCPGNFHWIHSIDSLELAKRLEQKCAEKRKTIQGLVQINLSKEATKSGLLDWDVTCQLGEYLLSCEWLQWKGLMTMADPQASEKQTRNGFATLYQWNEKLKQKFNAPQLTELSMGMSSDYPWAIEEGATLVRIGRAIFGNRD